MDSLPPTIWTLEAMSWREHFLSHSISDNSPFIKSDAIDLQDWSLQFRFEQQVQRRLETDNTKGQK